ncbi:MAG: M1 family metallopeptidase [Bacteroidota bacterium]
MLLKIVSLNIFTFFLLINAAISQTKHKNLEPDVFHYKTTIEVDIKKRQVKGKVTINFLINPEAKAVTFNCGALQITDIKGETVKGYEQKDNKVIILLNDRANNKNQIQIKYTGNPKSGVVFHSETEQVYTVFSTSEWMICNNTPNDKATLAIDLLISQDKTCIASGELIEKAAMKDKMLYSWKQDYASPAYTYGFVIGDFNKHEERYKRTMLKYFSKSHSPTELQIIFSKTKDMLDFFEEKSGLPYIQNTYSQILIGKHYQEMSGFSILKDTYGQLVLNDSTETNLISHELAHQWWGNMITCESWKHFWLNEGFATFMSAAYNEHRFGKAKYQADIESYHSVYEKIKAKGIDKSLVFANWINPTSDERNLVYFKGAYVLHLLRKELGDEKFWEAIRAYSKKYYGKSVTTADFQRTVEESSGKNLEVFFDEWIYKKK